jgi:ATP-binding cassette subfamily C protein CydCD
MEGQSAAERIFEILDQEALVPSQAENQKGLTTPLENITLDRVSFTYPGEEEPTLKNLNLTIKRGEQIALVGESGSGKSTLASLLLGFFPPDSGQININGIPLQDLDLDAWRERVAWVPQTPALFQDSIAANIRLARPEAELGAVAAAASAAHLAGWIESLPEGYETLIGEGGARLSGGQAQRLALARAFLKDAPVLLLDEPTSQLDPGTETRLADATRKLMEGRTAITIAHRLNTIFQADRILVLQDGKIVEGGTHRELMGMGGIYQALVEAYTPKGGEKLEITLNGGESEEVYPETESLLSPPLEMAVSPPPALPSTRNRRVLLRLAGFFRQHWGEVLLSALLGFLTVGSSVALMGASAWLISAAALHPSLAALQVAIVSVRFFGITRGVARYGERLVSHNLTFKILTKIRVWFYQALVPLAPARTLSYRAGDLLSRIISDIKSLEDFYVRSLSPPLVALLVGLGSGIFLGSYDPCFALILAGGFTLGGLFLPLLVRRLAWAPGRSLVEGQAQLGEFLVSYVQGLPDWLAFGQTENLRRRLDDIQSGYNRAQAALARVQGLNGGISLLVRELAAWLVLILAIPLVASGAISGVVLATLALVTLSAFEAVQPLPQAMETLSSSLESGSRLFEVADADPPVKDPARPAPVPEPLTVAARELSFTYPGSQPPALDRVSFELQEGEVVGLVGPSGGGKTTLINLLVRFWGDYGGELLLGREGISLEHFSQEDIRGKISLVSQRGYLFNATIRDNIALGNPDADPDAVIRAARGARIHSRIQALPQGYDTNLGERGVRFSAGERQRIHIARALLRDAPFWILDEPTANLDPRTERELLETLFEILRDKTGLLVTHRLVGLGRADRILVLQGGRVVESGIEEELLAGAGLYARMFSLQNRILRYS